MITKSLNEFVSSLNDCLETLRKVKKNKVRLSSNSYFASRFRSHLASFKKSFIKLQYNYPQEIYPALTFRLNSIEPLIKKLIEIYPERPNEMFQLLEEIKFKQESELAAEFELSEEKINETVELSYLPDDLIEEKYYVLKKILWEINIVYNKACYNSCASMIRRLTENLIILAFEQHKIENLITDENGEYFNLKDLIGKAISQPLFKLTRETKRILPDLKFFGDIGSHNRNALVRKKDLDKYYKSVRLAVEELYRNL